jgi:hypothetical protein
MSDLINELRGLTYTGTADYTAGTVAFWSDAQLEAVLDRHRWEVRDEYMTAYPTQTTGGSVEWYDYQSRYRWFESSDGGTARYIIKNSTGTTVAGTTYAAQYANGMVVFAADTGGDSYSVTGFAYDVYGAAADVWNQKAAYYASAIDFSTDNHNVRRSHILQNCERMAAKFDAMSGLPVQGSNIATIYRGDQA